MHNDSHDGAGGAGGLRVVAVEGGEGRGGPPLPIVWRPLHHLPACVRPLGPALLMEARCSPRVPLLHQISPPHSGERGEKHARPLLVTFSPHRLDVPDNREHLVVVGTEERGTGV